MKLFFVLIPALIKSVALKLYLLFFGGELFSSPLSIVPWNNGLSVFCEGVYAAKDY